MTVLAPFYITKVYKQVKNAANLFQNLKMQHQKDDYTIAKGCTSIEELNQLTCSSNHSNEEFRISFFQMIIKFTISLVKKLKAKKVPILTNALNIHFTIVWMIKTFK
jgi:hypothetical protein